MSTQGNVDVLLHFWAVISPPNNVISFRWSSPWNKPTQNVPVRNVFHHVSFFALKQLAQFDFSLLTMPRPWLKSLLCCSWALQRMGWGGGQTEEYCQARGAVWAASTLHLRRNQHTPECREEHGMNTDVTKPHLSWEFEASFPKGSCPSIASQYHSGHRDSHGALGLAGGVQLQGDSCLSWWRADEICS